MTTGRRALLAVAVALCGVPAAAAGQQAAAL